MSVSRFNVGRSKIVNFVEDVEQEVQGFLEKSLKELNLEQRKDNEVKVACLFRAEIMRVQKYLEFQASGDESQEDTVSSLGEQISPVFQEDTELNCYKRKLKKHSVLIPGMNIGNQHKRNSCWQLPFSQVVETINSMKQEPQMAFEGQKEEKRTEEEEQEKERPNCNLEEFLKLYLVKQKTSQRIYHPEEESLSLLELPKRQLPLGNKSNFFLPVQRDQSFQITINEEKNAFVKMDESSYRIILNRTQIECVPEAPEIVQEDILVHFNGNRLDVEAKKSSFGVFWNLDLQQRRENFLFEEKMMFCFNESEGFLVSRIFSPDEPKELTDFLLHHKVDRFIPLNFNEDKIQSFLESFPGSQKMSLQKAFERYLLAKNPHALSINFIELTKYGFVRTKQKYLIFCFLEEDCWATKSFQVTLGGSSEEFLFQVPYEFSIKFNSDFRKFFLTYDTSRKESSSEFKSLFSSPNFVSLSNQSM